MKVDIKANKIGTVMNADQMNVRLQISRSVAETMADDSVREVDTSNERVRVEHLLDELATVFSEREQAVLLASKAGFPKSQLPKFTTSLAFWTHVVADARNGAIPGGIQPFLDAAATLFPHNTVFTKTAE